MFRSLSFLLTLTTIVQAPAAHAVECLAVPLVGVPTVLTIDPNDKTPFPFDQKVDYEAVLKGTSCESSFSTVANEEVTFGWSVAPEVAKTLTLTVTGSAIGRPYAVKNRETFVLPAGTWKLVIERPKPTVGRLEDLKFTLRSRFKGEIKP